MKNFFTTIFDVFKALLQWVLASVIGIAAIPLLLWLVYFLFITVVGESKTFIIVEKTTYAKEKVKEDDLRVKEIWNSGEAFILNNSGKTIFLNVINYGGSYSDKSYNIKPSNEIQALEKEPDYIFKEPPSSIRVKGGGSRIRWHLKR